MARLSRLTLPGYLHHVIQRGHNRQPIVVDTEDHERLLDILRMAAREHGLAVHAYVLMPNHLHLLATPDSEHALARTMQALGRAYVRQFNRRHGRSGTLWEGRYRSALLEAETWLLPGMRYLDLNPVRAALVPTASVYRWSSHAHYAGLRADPLVTPHALSWALGNTPFAREQAYAAQVAAGLSPALQSALARMAHSGWALGSAPFLAELEQLTGRRARPGRPGRPPKPPSVGADTTAAKAAEIPTT